MNWLPHFFGLDNLAGPFYGFWSGIGSCFIGTAMVGTMAAHLRSRNCHTHRCWRFAHHPIEIDGAIYRVCRKHHPNAVDRLTADHIDALVGGGADGAGQG